MLYLVHIRKLLKYRKTECHKWFKRKCYEILSRVSFEYICWLLGCHVSFRLLQTVPGICNDILLASVESDAGTFLYPAHKRSKVTKQRNQTANNLQRLLLCQSPGFSVSSFYVIAHNLDWITTRTIASSLSTDQHYYVAERFSWLRLNVHFTVI